MQKLTRDKVKFLEGLSFEKVKFVSWQGNLFVLKIKVTQLDICTKFGNTYVGANLRSDDKCKT